MLYLRYNRITGEGCRRLAVVVSAKSNFTFQGPQAVVHSVERHRLKEEALRGSGTPALISKMAAAYMTGAMSTYTLPDRYAQAHCWFSLLAASSDTKNAAAGSEKLALLTRRWSTVWPFSLYPPLCDADCLEESALICKDPLHERQGIIEPDEQRRRHRQRRHRGSPHVSHNEL